MKKFKLSLLCFVLSISNYTFGSVKISEQTNLKTLSFSVDALKIEEKIIEGAIFSTAQLIGVEGYSAIKYDIGSPEVPVIRFFVEANSIDDIKITTHESKNALGRALSSDLKPVLDSLAKIAGSRYKLIQNARYKSLSAYPQEAFQIIPSGSINGVKRFMITLHPVEYLALNNSLKIKRSFDVTIKKTAQQKPINANNGLVFIVGDKFKNSPSLTSYMNLKKSLGFDVSILKVASKTPADQIRTKLKAHYNQNKGLRYVIIIGDADELPGKESSINGYTDHYFSSIDTDDYEADMNTPDLGVGRIAVANEAQLSVVLKKYTRYVKGEFPSSAWLSNLSFLATDDRYEVAEATHNYVIDNYTRSLGYKGEFPSPNQLGGDQLYAITHKADNRDVMDNITKGRTIINYSGHGANTYWDAPRVEQNDVRSLNSTSSSLPFVISNACITGDYRVDESFAETWQRHEWGAIMFWGSMDNTYWDEDDILEKRMFDGIFKLKKLVFTDITHYALSEMWREYGGAGRSKYYWETYHMFGDPSISIRLK